MFDAVIFDCDGVLVDSEILAIEAETTVLAEFGLDYDLEEYKRRFLGLHHHRFLETLDADFRARLGTPLPAAFPDALKARYEDMAHRIEAIEGVADAVAALGRAKAVASSSGAASLERKLRQTGLWDHFAPHVYSADLVARGKPHPDVFLHAAEALGVRPEACLVLEDSVNGVVAGLAAGMTVWGFSGGGHMDAAAEARLLEAGAAWVLDGWTAASAAWTTWGRVDPAPGRP
jgi:HAD superfamily hydrolase (TIGR01509 family)